MEHARALPGYLVTRYRGWRATAYAENKSWYRYLANEGQHPRAMVISCCDSRVSATSLFEADAGEIFLYRNIANHVPKFQPDGRHHGTPAAVEYAVTALRVAHLVVIGHSNCGGIRGAHDKFIGAAPQFDRPDSMIGQWLENLRPAFECTSQDQDAEERIHAMEKASVVLTLENLMGFSFVAEAVTSESLSLHGLWMDIGTGTLEQYDPSADAFVPV